MAISPDLQATAHGRCPRCEQPFHCGVGDPSPCPCSSIKLSKHMLLLLRERYASCLCLRCLQAISAGAAVDPVAGTTPAG
ncbi:MAG: cysteine-rich CWC family protein [Pseudomonadota bacterium]